MLDLQIKLSFTLEWCVNTDQGATNTMGFGCEYYEGLGYLYCGVHDNGDFTASEMCCDCGGGTVLGNVFQIS